MLGTKYSERPTSGAIGRGARPSTAVGRRVFVLACLSLAASAAAAAATVSYSGPQTLSSAGEDAALPQVAIDGSGRATIVWRRSDGSNDRIQSVRLAADGTRETIRTLSAAGEDASSPQLAIDGADRATVIWRRSDGSNERVQSVRLSANGQPQAVQTLSAAGKSALRPQVAIDDSDRPTITWERSDGSNARIEAVRLAADGTPGAVQPLSDAGQNARDPQVAIDGSDRATIIWGRSDGSNERVQSVRLAADGTPGTILTHSDPGQNAFGQQVAVAGSNGATIVWRRFDGADLRIQSVRLGADRTPEPVQTLSEAGEGADRVQIAIDGFDRATIIWQRFDGSDFRIQSVRLAADGTPGAIETLSEEDRDGSRNQLAVDSSGRATIAWDHNDFPQTVQAVRLQPDGTPGPLKTLSEVGETAFSPQVATDASDRATIVWQRSDGTHQRIQATRGEITYPGTTIISGPEGLSNESDPSFGFSSETPGTGFECRLDTEEFSLCVSPKSYFGLPDGPHEFLVRAVDGETDADVSPATRELTIDTSVDGSARAKQTQKQKGKKIVVKAEIEADEDLDAEAGGKVKVGKKSYKLDTRSKSVDSGKSKTLKLKPKKPKHAKRIARSLKQGKKATAKLTAELSDDLGNTESEKLSVTLKG